MASSLTTASSTPSATSGSTSAPTQTPAQQAHATWIGTLVAIGVLGVYGIIAIITFIAWAVRRCTREAEPDPTYLPPEATTRGDGAFLVPTSQSQTKATPSGRTSSRGSALSGRGGRGGRGGRNKGRPRTGTVASVVSDGRSVRSMFYEGPGYQSQPSLSAPQHESASSPNLISLQSPMHSPVYTPEGSTYAGSNEHLSVRSSRSKASSVASSRFYQPEYHAQTTPPILEVPDAALTSDRSGWV